MIRWENIIDIPRKRYSLNDYIVGAFKYLCIMVTVGIVTWNLCFGMYLHDNLLAHQSHIKRINKILEGAFNE